MRCVRPYGLSSTSAVRVIKTAAPPALKVLGEEQSHFETDLLLGDIAEVATGIDPPMAWVDDDHPVEEGEGCVVTWCMRLLQRCKRDEADGEDGSDHQAGVSQTNGEKE